MVGDFNWIVFQNILKGDFPGALNAVGDALNPFSDSLELRYDGASRRSPAMVFIWRFERPESSQ